MIKSNTWNIFKQISLYNIRHLFSKLFKVAWNIQLSIHLRALRKESQTWMQAIDVCITNVMITEINGTVQRLWRTEGWEKKKKKKVRLFPWA